MSIKTENANKSISKISKIIFTAIVLLISSLLFTNVSNAAFTDNGGMPDFGKRNATTGLFPQIMNTGTVTGAPATNTWTNNITSKVVYCDNSGTILRNGKIDSTIYYIGDSSYSAACNTMRNNIRDYIEDNYTNVSNINISLSLQNSSGYKQVNTSEPLYWVVLEEDMGSHGALSNKIIDNIRTKMTQIMSALAEIDKPKLIQDLISTSSTKDYPEYDGGWEYGPQVCVMQTSQGKQDGYAKTGATQTAKNNQLAYILTAKADDAYSATPYKKYSEEDIQTANWLLVDKDGYIVQKHLTQNGKVLKQKAEEYEKFLNEIKGGYSTSIDASNAQVISNQNSKNYIIGPFYMTYPEYQDISYVKAIHLTTDTGKTFTYDETHGELEIIYGRGAAKSNGQQKVYPASGDYFYIKFSAKNANYPKNASVYVDFEYIGETSVQYNYFTTGADIYQYIGYGGVSGEHTFRRGVLTATASFKYETYDKVGEYTCNHYDKEGNLTRSHKKSIYEWVTHTGHFSTDSHTEYKIILYQPYIQMEYVSSDKAQPLKEVLSSSKTRTYTVVNGKKVDIDLTFELGGLVWIDGTAGKESNYDGLYNTAKDPETGKQIDTPMSNVKVTLYKSDGSKIAETRTDGNGKYLFNNLNAMYQYYVKFTYNGQYYQPTIYNADKSDSNWNNTSKGLDILTQRDAYNVKFQEIGSNPRNLVDSNGNSMEVYTRTELEQMGAIDKFGNSNGTNAYANYCMTDSYTCNGTTTKDLYPAYKVFVLDDHLNKITKTSSVLSFVGSNNIKIIYANPDVMHHINQGYVLREELDIAIKKDVYNATLEINGKTQTYTYDKRQLNENGDWEVSTRISDAYYKSNYSREIYREDYEYKTDDYTATGLNNNFDVNAAGISQENELRIYITYKLTIRNQSDTLAARVTEMVDYYDQEYTLISSDNTVEREQKYKPYIGDSRGNKLSNLITSNSSIYGANTQTSINGYNTTYVTGMENVLLDPDINKDCYLYITFSVNKDQARNVILDEQLSDGTAIGVGKENIAEINGYKSFYGSKTHAPNENNPRTTPEYSAAQYDKNNNLVKQGDIAGKTDVDSVPGNLDPAIVPKDNNEKVSYENLEDDTDKAPNIRIILNRNNIRTIDGTVWEDERNITTADAQIGDGLRSEDETGVNGVRVQLVEVLDNGQEYIWKEVNSGDTIIQSLVIDNLGIEKKTTNGEAVVHSYNIDKDGQYKFESFMPGNYIVRFIYGDGTTTVLGTKSTDYYTGATIDNPVTNLIDTANGYDKTSQEQGYNSATENIGLNVKSYNGQDYKSTIYQYNLNDETGVNNGESAYTNTESKTYTYNFSGADEQLYSDAKDIMSRRQTVNSYSTTDVTNHKAEVLASFERIPTYNGIAYSVDEMAKLLNELLPNTYMIAETGVIDVNFEYNRSGAEMNNGSLVYTNTSTSGNSNIGSSNYEMCGYYNIANLDFGLQQRPKAQLKVSKQVTNVKVTLANGSTLFDASSRATNVLWNDHIAHGPDTKNTYTISNNYDDETLNNYKDNLMKTPIARQNAKNKGLIQLTMDEELMHGATIQVTYAITVANIGEADYNENQFYYTGKVANPSTIVKTTPNTLVDYIGFQAESGNATRNNLQFIAAQNPDWSVISVDELISGNENDESINNNLINSRLKDNANKYTTIIKTDSLSKELKPIITDEDNAKKIDNAFSSDPLNALDTVNSSESVVGVQLVLSQMLTSDNNSDDMTYNNLVELVRTSNQVGRRMAYSVVGNQDPTLEPQEIDADDSQEITILPPFGQNYIYYILGTAIAVILIAGIVLVIRVVKKRK